MDAERIARDKLIEEAIKRGIWIEGNSDSEEYLSADEVAESDEEPDTIDVDEEEQPRSSFIDDEAKEVGRRRNK